jgi:glycerate kinase
MCDDEGVPCIAIVGVSDEEAIIKGLTAYFSICNKPMSMDESFARATCLIQAAASNCVKLWIAQRNR